MVKIQPMIVVIVVSVMFFFVLPSGYVVLCSLAKRKNTPFSLIAIAAHQSAYGFHGFHAAMIHSHSRGILDDP